MGGVMGGLPNRLRARRAPAGRGRERAQAIVWAVVMVPLFLAVVGLAIDGGIAFAARRDLQNVADAAARAGAMQIDQRLYRESLGATIALDAGSARRVAAEYLAGQGPGLAATIGTERRRVIVAVSREVPTSFLRLVGIATMRVGAVAPADVQHGIERAER